MAVIALSGQVTVTTAGTAVSFTTAPPGTYLIKPLGGNGGTYVYVGNDGADDVTTQNGYQMKKALLEDLYVTVTNLNELRLNADGDGDGVSWLRTIGEGQGVRPPV
jgi:hypothetical protein